MSRARAVLTGAAFGTAMVAGWLAGDLCWRLTDKCLTDSPAVQLERETLQRQYEDVLLQAPVIVPDTSTPAEAGIEPVDCDHLKIPTTWEILKSCGAVEVPTRKVRTHSHAKVEDVTYGTNGAPVIE